MKRPICYLTGASKLVASAPGLLASPTVAARLTMPIAGSNGALVVPMQGGDVMVMSLPHPLPMANGSDDLAQRAAWPDWRRAQQLWRSHLIVSSMKEPSNLDGQRALSAEVLRVAAAFASHMPVDGVAWAGSGLVLPAKEMVVGAARNPLPPELLIRCLWRLSAGGPPRRFLSTGTAGLGFFGLPELRDDTGEQDTDAIRNRLLNLGSYLITSGPVIGDGEVCGSGGTNPDGAFQVHHARDSQGQLLLTLDRLGQPTVA